MSLNSEFISFNEITLEHVCDSALIKSFKACQDTHIKSLYQLAFIHSCGWSHKKTVLAYFFKIITCREMAIAELLHEKSFHSVTLILVLSNLNVCEGCGTPGSCWTRTLAHALCEQRGLEGARLAARNCSLGSWAWIGCLWGGFGFLFFGGGGVCGGFDGFGVFLLLVLVSLWFEIF